MPGLSGSQQAYKQARSGIARFGSTRFNYYTPNVVVTINNTDRTTKVIVNSLRIHQGLNDDPDTASFTLKNSAGFTPTAAQTVTIGLGTSANLEFGGQIGRLRHRRLYPSSLPFFDVECVDWQRLFDRRLINYTWTSISASIIAKQIVSNWTSGFTTRHIEEGLQTIDYFPCTNEQPSAAMRRLAHMIGSSANFYIDPSRDVHFFGASGETAAGHPTAPVQITNTLSTTKQFSHQYDETQRRTYVATEGKRTSILRAFAANSNAGLGYGIPVTDAGIFDAVTQTVRLNQEILSISARNINTTTALVTGPRISSKISASVSSGATSFQTTSRSWYDLVAGAVYVNFSGVILSIASISGGGPYTFTLAGSDTFPGDVDNGEQFTVPDTVTLTTSPTQDINVDDEIMIRVIVEDTTAQAALAAIEGGDGIHQEVLSDGRLNYNGAQDRSQGEIDVFAGALVAANWRTTDFNARPGRLQSVALTSPTVTETVMVTSADLQFVKQNIAPFRNCEGASVRIAGWRETLTD